MLLNNTPINVGMNFGVRSGAQAGARCRHEHNYGDACTTFRHCVQKRAHS